MTKLFIIGLGGFIGAVARYGISGWAMQLARPSTFPYGTLAVNVIGCFILGGVMALVENGRIFTPQVRLFLTVGILGSLTTFSTFGYETLELLKSNEIRLLLFNIFGNILLGLIAVVLGRMFVRVIF